MTDMSHMTVKEHGESRRLQTKGLGQKNEYKCQISTFVFLLKHECTEWRAERCV